MSDYTREAEMALEMVRLRRELESVRAERDAAVKQITYWRQQIDYCRQQLADSRADERQAMTYLEQCRQAVGHDGDFPSLVERLRGASR